MEFRILGPLEVHSASGPIRLGGPKQRALLVLLLLHRGEAMSTDRLVDALWGEQPPPAAVKTVQTYVSQLRKALGDGVVATRGHAYVLERDAASVDADRFGALVADGRELLRAGAPGRAADRLRAALALWRGPALADVAYEAFAQHEIARLEELRISATEDRIEAEIAAGRAGELVPELEALVREHPLRERLRGQLMLALYRSGRQADALAAYQDARRRLTEELGLEPGPELRALQHAILAHDPALGSAWRARSPARRRRGAALLVVGGALVAVAALAAATLTLTGSGRSARLSAVAPNSVGMIDPRSGYIVAELPVGDGPVAVTVGRGGVWVANGGDQTLSRVDPRKRDVVASVGTGRVPTDVAIGGGAVWVANATTGTATGTVSRIEPLSRAASAIRVRHNVLDDFAPPTPSALTIGEGRVWTNHVRNQIASFAIGEEESVHRFGLGAEHSVDGLIFANGSLWAASSASDRVFRIDPTRRAVVAEIPIAAAPGQRVAGPYGLAAGFGSIWVADSLAGAVSRVDPRLNAVTATIHVGRRPTRLAVGEGAVWVLNAGDQSVSRIDPRTNAVGRAIRVGGLATDVAAGAGAVWVTVAGGNPAPTTATTPPAVARSLPRTSCSPVVAAPGTRPRYLIAADLPRRLLGRRSAETASMAAAVRLMLAERGFRAGRYPIGLQICDASSRREGHTDPERCSGNARAYAANPSVIGIVGPYHSWCASIQLPILNSASGGPVTAVSPSNTYVGLTHSGPETTADEPDRYRPTGTSAYARVVAPDDAQGAALATLARELGVRRLFLLHDETGYGYGIARYVGDSARRVGVHVSGLAGWDPEHTHYRGLAATVRRSRADGVLLAGCACSNGPRLVADLRDQLGPRPRFLLNDAWTDIARPLRRVADAAQGAYMTTAGVAPDRLPPAGRVFAERLRNVAGAGEAVSGYVIAAAQAADVLLDAIARSDGTRPSVAAALRRTRIQTGLLGEVGFDANGDPVHRPFTVFRFDFHRPPMKWGDIVQDTVIDRIVVPRPELLERTPAARAR